MFQLEPRVAFYEQLLGTDRERRNELILATKLNSRMESGTSNVRVSGQTTPQF